LQSIDTIGLNSDEIYNLRVAAIYHDINKVIPNKMKGKNSDIATEIWKDQAKKLISINPENSDQIGKLIQHHDTLGYFSKSPNISMEEWKITGFPP